MDERAEIEVRFRSNLSRVAGLVGLYQAQITDNNPGDIVELLTRIGVSFRIEGPSRNILAALMSRRHQIAHRADRNSIVGVGQPTVEPLRISVVLGWTVVVQVFGEGLLERV